MNILQSVLFFVFLLLSNSCVKSYRQDDYLIQSSFLQGNNVLDVSNELSEAFLTEFEEFNTKVLDKLTDKLVLLFRKDGFDLNNRDNLDKLVVFLQSADVLLDPSQEKPLTFRQKLLNGLKKAASGIGKEFLVHATKAMVAYGVKQALPEIEKMFKNALSGLPVNLRVAVAPLVFKMWKNLFQNAQIPIPKSFNLRGIIFDGLNEEQRKEAEAYLRDKFPEN